MNVSIGMVLKLHVIDTIPPKVKRFIIVGITDDEVSFATIYINSEINEYVNWSEELKALHICFESKGRNYLDHTSYIDCSKLVIKDCLEIENIVKNRPKSVIGQLSFDDFSIVKTMIISANTIKGKHKNKFGFYV